MRLSGGLATRAAGSATGRASGGHRVRTAIAGTRNSVEARKKLLHFGRLAFGAVDAVFGGRSKYQLFKFQFALCTLVFKYRHNYLKSRLV